MHMFHLITVAVVLLVQSSAGAKLNFLTRNVALHNSTETFPPRQDRLKTMIEELRTSDADGICLQEVWYSNDMEQIMNELQMEYPYSFSKLHRPDSTYIERAYKPPCSVSRVSEVSMCLISNCSTASNTSEAVTCLVEKCSFRIIRLSTKCRVCLLMSSDINNFGNCVARNNFTMNLGGLLYLSKRKITRSSFNPLGKPEGGMFTDVSDGRGYLSMDIKGIDGIVACTHVTEVYNSLVFFEPNATDSSFAGRNIRQINQLMTELDQDQVILMGTFGTGPKFKKRVLAELPKSYKVIKETTPAFKRSSVKRCTECSSNTVIDHIFVRGHKMKSSRRVFLNDTLTNHAGMSALVRTVSLN